MNASASGVTVNRWVMFGTAAIACAIALQAIYVAWAGEWDLTYGRAWLLCGAIIVALLANPLDGPFHGMADEKPAPSLKWRLFDLVLIVIIVAATIRFVQVQYLLEVTLYLFQPLDWWLALAGVVVLLEATRRLFGWPIVIIAIAGLLYCYAGPYLPGFLYHSGMDLNRTMQTVFYGFQGIFGLPLGVVIRVVLIFVVFGVLLEATGASDALIRTSVALTGGTRGGPAHSAVVASALFGSMSGSVTANVVGSGTFTIPMIKRRGFSPATAGGIEAAASSGGQIVPPVMGAAAFLMADLTGEPYGTIALAALLPAVFYYGSLFCSISVQAAADGVQPVPESERVTLTRHDLVASLLFLLPILSIVIVLLAGRSPAMAGLVATGTALALGLLRKETRNNPKRLLAALAKAGRACASILVAVGCIGVVLGVLNLTGLGLSFASLIAEYSRSSLLMALFVTAFACLVLGMGMPTLPAYLIIILVLGPVMTQMGAELLAVHMFVFYFGVLSAITPPVAIGAFAAAPIAGADPMRTAFSALRLAIAGFMIPFVFVYEPGLLLIGDFEPLTMLRVIVALGLAIWMINTALVGFSAGRLSWVARLVRLVVTAGLLVQIGWIQALFIALAIALIAARRLPAYLAQRTDAPSTKAS